jgi:hypothetical protein
MNSLLGTGQPVETPDDKDIAQLLDHILKNGPVPSTTAGSLPEHPPAAGRFQRGDLRCVRLLVAFADPRIASQVGIGHRPCHFTNVRLRSACGNRQPLTCVFHNYLAKAHLMASDL